MPGLARSRRRRRMTYLSRSRRYLQALSPYLSIMLLTVPLVFVEPVKLVAVYVAGTGRWITGSIMLIAAYAISIYFIERLFRILKPKVMMLRWFATLWNSFVGMRDRAWVFVRFVRNNQ